MKKLIAIIILASCSQAFATSVYDKLENKDFPYSALNVFIKKTGGRPLSSSESRSFERLVSKTGVEILEDYNAGILESYATPSTHLILASKALKNREYSKVLDLTSKIPSGHPLYAESLLLSAQAHSANNNYPAEISAYEDCASAAKSISDKELERYSRIVHETCLANKARRQFKAGNHNEALEAFNRFPKNSYLWPYMLYERAWLYFHKGDYNRALGLLVTYKAPLLDTYFFPEAEYLSALNYLKLCLWQDSSIIINQYYKIYRPRFYALEKILRENKNKPNYFFNLMIKQDGELKNENFVKQIVLRLRKQQRFVVGFHQIRAIDGEIKRILKNEKKEVQKILLPHLKHVKNNLIRKLDNHAKVDVFNFLKTVKFFSNEMFKMNLEIMSRKKDLVYENKKLIADRSRGDYSNVKRSRFEYFWKFEGAFWADELGDYSLGLKSNCETIKR